MAFTKSAGRLVNWVACNGSLQMLQIMKVFQMEASMTDAVTKLKVEELDREQAKKGANFLDRASALEHGGSH